MKKLFILILVSFITTISVAQSRYRGFVNTGYSFGSGEYGFSQWHINTVHGVDLFHNNLFIGGGIGLGISTESDILRTYSLPVFADVRYTLCNLKVRPYIDMKIGYSELFDEEHDGGGDNSGSLYISPSVGVSLPVTKKTSIHVGIGYTYNQAKYEFSYIPGTGSMGRNNTRFNAGGLTLSVGVSF